MKVSNQMPMASAVQRIETLNRSLAVFWKNADGWAPIEAAGILSKSRLDWQVSLSSTLRLWLREPPSFLSDGELILAWVNLGSLIEGTLKLFLSAYYDDFRKDICSLKTAGAYDHGKGDSHRPDRLTLDRLKKFCSAANLFQTEGSALIELVQSRRNAVHAFKNRPIGNDTEFQDAIRCYLVLLRAVNDQLPYPDGMTPQEI
jgi:hypothetical protein